MAAGAKFWRNRARWSARRLLAREIARWVFDEERVLLFAREPLRAQLGQNVFEQMGGLPIWLQLCDLIGMDHFFAIEAGATEPASANGVVGEAERADIARPDELHHAFHAHLIGLQKREAEAVESQVGTALGQRLMVRKIGPTIAVPHHDAMGRDAHSDERT